MNAYCMFMRVCACVCVCVCVYVCVSVCVFEYVSGQPMAVLRI